MSETVEVRSVLRLDDQSSHVVEKLKGGYEHLAEKVGEVEHEMLSMAKTAVATAAGFQLFQGVESIKEFAHEVFAAAQGLGAEQKALAASIAVGDRTGRSYDEIKQQANELHEELEGLGVTAGASTESIVDAFETIQSRSNRGVESTKELVEQMVYAGRVVPGGMEGIAGAFRDLEAGIVRPKNQLVQLMIMTGTVEGSAKKVAKGLNSMIQGGQQDKVLELAEKAVARMSEKAKDMPPTFGQVVASLKTLRENVFETMGAPAVKAITPQLDKIRRYFVDNKEAVEHWAKAAGVKVGEWITAAAEKVQKGFEYLKSHAAEIREAIEHGVEQARKVVEFILAHREGIAMAFGAKVAAPLVGSAVGGIGQLAGLVKGAAAGGAPSLGLAGGGLIATAATVGAFAVAVGAFALAVDQWQKLMNITHGKSDAEQDEEARKSRIADLGGEVGKVNVGEFDELRQKYVEQAEAVGQTSREAGEYVDKMWAQHAALRAQAEVVDDASARANFGNDFEGASQWVVAYDKAVAEHSEALQKYAASVLAGNETLFNALLSSGSKVEGGFDHLAELVQGKSEEFAKVLRTMTDEKGKAPDKVQLNFNNANIHIKQEFREGDPDRILLAFRKDLVRNAVARSQSRIGVPFGM